MTLVFLLPAQSKLALETGCTGVTIASRGFDGRGDVAPCEAVYDGLILSGYDAALKELVSLSKGLFVDRRDRIRVYGSSSATVRICSPPPTLPSSLNPGLLRLIYFFLVAVQDRLVALNNRIARQLSVDYLAPILSKSSELFVASLSSYQSTFLATYIAVSACFVVYTLFVYFFVYRPHIVRLDKEMKQMYTWLLLFPEEVVK